MTARSIGSKDIFDASFDKRIRDFVHTSFPATITRIVNAAVVDVQPLISTLRPNGQVIPYPEIPNVRIQTYAARRGDVFISLPYAVGDLVWVMVSERDTALLMEQSKVEAITTQTHDLSDCFCIPMFFTDQNIPAYSNEHLVIANKNTRITVADGKVTVDTNEYVLNASTAILNVDKLTVNGDVEVNGDSAFEGGIENNGVDIGETHKHIGVTTGSGTSGIVA